MPELVNSVLLVIVFLVPGFIFRSVEGQFVYLDKRLQWERLALGLITRSTVVYLPFAPWFYQAWQTGWPQTHPIRSGLIALALLFLLPAFLGLIVGAFHQGAWLKILILKCGLKTFEQHHIPSAWDHRFSDIQPAWVIVRLKDGHLIRGFLGADSYVSSDPEERDIFISHVIAASGEGGALTFVNDTQGVYVRGEDISTIEFIRYEEATSDAPESSAEKDQPRV